MDNNYLNAENILKEYKQEHLLHFYNELDEKEKKSLLEDILKIDFKQMKTLYENINNDKKDENIEIEKMDYINKQTLSQEEKEYYDKIGRQSIKNGEYAVVTMAGGQRNKAWTFWT